MQTPVDDVLSLDAESNENQGQCASDSVNVALNTDDDMLPTVISCEHTNDNVVIFSDETCDMLEDEIKVTSAQIVKQYDNDENCDAALPSVASELSIHYDTEPEMNTILQECLSVSGTVLRPANESCVTEVPEVETQQDKSNVVLKSEETAFIQDVYKNEELKCREVDSTQENEIKVISERESIQDVKQNDSGETCAPAKPLVDSDSSTLPKTRSAQQDCLSVDVFPTVDSREPSDNHIVICNEETGDLQEYEVKITSESDSDSDCVVLDVFRSEEVDCEKTACVQTDEITVTSETKSTQVVRQYHNCESCAAAASVADLELSAHSDIVSETNSAVSRGMFTPENDNCVAKVTEVEIQHDKSDMISTLGETDFDCITRDVSGSEAMYYQPTRNVDEVVVDLLNDDDVPTANRVQQECLPFSEAALEPASASCVTNVAEVEMQHNNNHTILTYEETGSDCIIQGVSGLKEWDFGPAENEGKMTVDLRDCDNNCCHSPEMVQSSRVMTSSSRICPEYTSQTGVNLSVPTVPTMQTSIFDVASVLPFPSLITELNTGELCPYNQFSNGENAVDNASFYRVAHDELIDTEVSRASGLDSENGCLRMADSGYPVVEIVPPCDGAEEQPGVSAQKPCTTAAAAFSGLSNVAGIHGDITVLGSITASDNSSRHGKASWLLWYNAAYFCFIIIVSCFCKIQIGCTFLVPSTEP